MRRDVRFSPHLCFKTMYTIAANHMLSAILGAAKTFFLLWRGKNMPYYLESSCFGRGRNMPYYLESSCIQMVGR